MKGNCEEAGGQVAGLGQSLVRDQSGEALRLDAATTKKSGKGGGMVNHSGTAVVTLGSVKCPWFSSFIYAPCYQAFNPYPCETWIEGKKAGRDNMI